MNASLSLSLLAFLLVTPTRPADAPGPAPARAADLAGLWVGTLAHEGETQPIALGFEPDTAGRVTVTLSVPVVHLDRVAMGRFELRAVGDSIVLGPFRFAYDRAARTLSGVMPRGLVPVHSIPMRLEQADRFEPPPRPPLSATAREPAWTFEAGSPLWAGPVFADGIVYAGAQDGRLFALDAATGATRWTFRAGGAIRTRPAVAGSALYFQADDGFVYALDARDGASRWREKIVEKPIERLPFDNPKSRYDRFGSDVTAADGRLYVGTHDGKVLALDPADGRQLWSFAAGDAVLAAPAVHAGRVYFGSYDRHVYALEAASGGLVWKRDTRGAVVSTPALDGDRVVVGNRCYDLIGLDAATGETAWKRYVWMSWVESSATIRDGVAYVGSSDAAAVFAFDAKTGERRWTADVFGWAWGQPAVTDARVYAGTAGQAGYPVRHDGAVVALDRASGGVVWRYAGAPPDSGAFGFPGSPAVGGGRVYASGLDGRVYAFPE